MDQSDPRRVVEAPMRRALGLLTARGVILVAGVVLAVVAPTVRVSAGFDGHAAADLVAITLTAVLLGYAALVFGRARAGGPPEEALAGAWHAAREVDPADALLALGVAGWVPVAIAAALVVMTWPHLNDPNPALRGAWAVLGVPTIVLAWILATNAWLHGCRASLADAEAESRRRFRGYWANAGH